MNPAAMFQNPPCPHLPEVHSTLAITHTRPFRAECGEAFFHACHELAQSLWQSGSPAQAILQLDKAMMAQVDDSFTMPYEAILWMVTHCPDDQFIGNPVRHFQHLASRMNFNQPQPELRIWRAWACLHLTEQIIANPDFTRDEEQIRKENLIIPSLSEVFDYFKSSARENELAIIQSLLSLK